MTDPRRIPDDILCLAHTDHNREWCDRYQTCRRHIDISAKGCGEVVGVLFRVCQPGVHDQYIDVVK